MSRKYLEELHSKTVTNYCHLLENKEDDREAIWEKERQIYGFDNRETWSLDFTFYLWLYERLMMYKEIGGQVINLSYHRFFKYKNKEYTQLELIDEMLTRLRFCFSEEYNEWDEDHYEYVHEIEAIWAVVLPAMWW